MAIRTNPTGVSYNYWPFINELEGVGLFLMGTECLAAAGIIKVYEVYRDKKSHLLITSNDVVGDLIKEGKKLIQQGSEQISTVLTGILIGAGFTFWLQQDME